MSHDVNGADAPLFTTGVQVRWQRGEWFCELEFQSRTHGDRRCVEGELRNRYTGDLLPCLERVMSVAKGMGIQFEPDATLYPEEDDEQVKLLPADWQAQLKAAADKVGLVFLEDLRQESVQDVLPAMLPMPADLFSRLVPLPGKCFPAGESFADQIRRLRRPYYRLTEQDYTLVVSLAGEADVLLLDGNIQVTFGNADGGWALMPLGTPIP